MKRIFYYTPKLNAIAPSPHRSAHEPLSRDRWFCLPPFPNEIELWFESCLDRSMKRRSSVVNPVIPSTELYEIQPLLWSQWPPAGSTGGA